MAFLEAAPFGQPPKKLAEEFQSRFGKRRSLATIQEKILRMRREGRFAGGIDVQETKTPCIPPLAVYLAMWHRMLQDRIFQEWEDAKNDSKGTAPVRNPGQV